MQQHVVLHTSQYTINTSVTITILILPLHPPLHTPPPHHTHTHTHTLHAHTHTHTHTHYMHTHTQNWELCQCMLGTMGNVSSFKSEELVACNNAVVKAVLCNFCWLCLQTYKSVEVHTGFYHPSLALCRIFRSVCGVYRCVHAFPVNKTARSVCGMCVCVCVCARSPSKKDSQISVWHVCVLSQWTW